MKMMFAAVKVSLSCLLNVTSMMGDTPSEPYDTEEGVEGGVIKNTLEVKNHQMCNTDIMTSN